LRRLADFRGKKLLLLFFNPRCGFCTRMAPELAALPIDGASGAPLPLVVTTGGLGENQQLVAEDGLTGPVPLQEGMEIGSQDHGTGPPMGYLIDDQGRIASELAIGAPPLLALAAAGVRGAAPAQPAPVHDAGPAAGALGGQRELSDSKIQRDGLPAGTPAP